MSPKRQLPKPKEASAKLITTQRPHQLLASGYMQVPCRHVVSLAQDTSDAGEDQSILRLERGIPVIAPKAYSSSFNAELEIFGVNIACELRVF